MAGRCAFFHETLACSPRLLRTVETSTAIDAKADTIPAHALGSIASTTIRSIDAIRDLWRRYNTLWDESRERMTREIDSSSKIPDRHKQGTRRCVISVMMNDYLILSFHLGRNDILRRAD